jgi:hypothetical protein
MDNSNASKYMFFLQIYGSEDHGKFLYMTITESFCSLYLYDYRMVESRRRINEIAIQNSIGENNLIYLGTVHHIATNREFFNVQDRLLEIIDQRVTNQFPTGDELVEIITTHGINEKRLIQDLQKKQPLLY